MMATFLFRRSRRTPVQENYGADTGITLYDTEDTSTDRTSKTDEIDPEFSVDVDEPDVVSEFAKHPMSETEVKNLAFEMMTR